MCDNYIGRCSTRETNAVVWILPRGIGWHKERHRTIHNIYKLRVSELLKWDLVGWVGIHCKNYLLGPTGCSVGHEVRESYWLITCWCIPSSITLDFVHRQRGRCVYMEFLWVLITTGEHKTHLIHAQAVVQIRAIQSFCFTVNHYIGHLNWVLI